MAQEGNSAGRKREGCGQQRRGCQDGRTGPRLGPLRSSLDAEAQPHQMLFQLSENPETLDATRSRAAQQAREPHEGGTRSRSHVTKSGKEKLSLRCVPYLTPDTQLLFSTQPGTGS